MNNHEIENSIYKKDSKSYLIKSTNFKIAVILGDINVGKTNIVRRLLGQGFEELESTVGVEFGYIEANDVDRDNDVSLSIQLWDTCNIN